MLRSGDTNTTLTTRMPPLTRRSLRVRRGFTLDGLAVETRCVLALKAYIPIVLNLWRKNGRPLYVYRLASLEPVEKELHATPPERRYQRMYGAVPSDFTSPSDAT
jgi:hypothetical protein